MCNKRSEGYINPYTGMYNLPDRSCAQPESNIATSDQAKSQFEASNQSINVATEQIPPVNTGLGDRQSLIS